jgi:hypothetical protein
MQYPQGIAAIIINYQHCWLPTPSVTSATTTHVRQATDFVDVPNSTTHMPHCAAHFTTVSVIPVLLYYPSKQGTLPPPLISKLWSILI